MGMNQDLAAMYNTPGATQEDQEKVAEAQLFAKLAAENGIALKDLSDEQVTTLWNNTFSKEGSAAIAPGAPVEDEQAKVAAAAQQEFATQQEWQTKVAECDKLGRIMAHAYTQELGKIAEAGKTATSHDMPPQFGGKKDKEEDDKGDKKKEEKEEEKEASAIDQLAARHAVELATAAENIDEKVAAARIAAVMTLGPAPSEKTASATSVDETVHIRSLELLETAGYPVTWEGE